MSLENVVSLRDYCNEKIASASSAPLSTDEETEEIEATRDNPALIGDRVLVEYGEAKLAITIVNCFRGEPAARFAKSFNRYNTSSYQMGKGTEWVLLYLKIEALSTSEDRIDISDYYFHMISDKGIDLGSSYIADNPLPVNSMYADSSQNCWYGMYIPVGTNAFLNFEGGYDGDTYWFDLSHRRQVDTSSITYPDLAKGDSGDSVNALQFMLTEYGFMTKIPSGVIDSNTITALKKFQKSAGIESTGLADDATQKLLFSGAPLPQ